MTLPFHASRLAGPCSPFGCRSGPTRALVDNVVAAVDVKCLASDEAGCVVRQESGGDADIVDADQAAGRSLRLRFVEQLVELRYSRSCPRCRRAGRMACIIDVSFAGD